MQKDIVELVSKFGLDTSEARVYAVLLAHDKLTVAEVSRMTRMHRATCYGVLDRLVAKGCVSMGGRRSVRTFVAIPPMVLLERMRESLDTLSANLPALTTLWERVHTTHGANLYVGADGVRYVQERIMNQGQPLSIFGDGDAFKAAFPEWSRRIAEMRRAKRSPVRLLLRESDYVVRAARRIRSARDPSVRMRVLPESYAIVGGFDVSGETVALYSFQDEPRVVVIEDPVISSLMQTVYDLLWAHAEVYDRTIIRPRT